MKKENNARTQHREIAVMNSAYPMRDIIQGKGVPLVARKLTFCGPLLYKQALWYSKVIVNLPWWSVSF